MKTSRLPPQESRFSVKCSSSCFPTIGGVMSLKAWLGAGLAALSAVFVANAAAQQMLYGPPVYVERMDTVQFGSIPIAQDKAHAAAAFRRTTKSVYDEMEKGGAGLRYLNLRGFVTSEGGELLVQDGKVVGAIGCSGGSGAQDGVCARAGAGTVK